MEIKTYTYINSSAILQNCFNDNNTKIQYFRFQTLTHDKGACVIYPFWCHPSTYPNAPRTS